ncbi:MAG: hypothetical protein Q8R02_08220 [Hyphomonadaceae bacterium]|nr:hypothetical protein [Hyphomonadaceae bacterium]
MTNKFKYLAAGVAVAAIASAGLMATAAPNASPTLQSAGALAWAPNGVLLIGDSAGGQIVAVETGDTAKAAAGKVEVADLSAKIAALLGTTADQIAVNDVAVNPNSGAVYMSVSRGLGAEAKPVILKADRAGALTEVKIDAMKRTAVSLSDAPAPDAKSSRGQLLRTEAVTDIGYVNGQVLVAGLSNEEFSSSMRSFAYPFQASAKGASIEMYHGAHGQFETAAPVRTFMTYDIGGKPNVLAAYTCTPLVKIPVEAFKPGAKIKATTIAELGNRNRPLDMIAYKKGGKDFILMANSARGMMKIDAKEIDKHAASTKIETRIADKAGVPYETLAEYNNTVVQLDKVDDTSAVIVTADADKKTALKTIALP